MANNPYVNKVQLADGTTILDITDTTAIASDVASGKYFYLANGTKTLGTATSSGITPTGTISITQNGTTDVTNYASASVSVPNTYSASDEGKVVSNGALVSQTSATYTTNNTYDTTTVNSVTVNVSGGDLSVMPMQAYMTRTLREQDRDWDFGTTSVANVLTNHQYFYRNLNLTSIKWLLSSSTTIKDCSYAFYRCTSLKTVVMPKITGTMYSTATYMFGGCTALEKVDASFTQIMQNTYNGCSSLTMLVIRATSIRSLYNINAFTGTPFASSGTGGTLYVPSDLISSYQSASNWSTILGYTNNAIKSIESTHTDPYAPIDLTLYYADGTLIPT